jgi:hypothetical protein
MKIALTKPQARALIKGKGVQLKASQLGEGMEMPLPADLEKKLMRAMRQGKGARMKVEPEIHGEGFFSWIKENILSPLGSVAKSVLPGLVQSVAAPVLTGVLTKKLGGAQKAGSFKVAGKGKKGGSFKVAGKGSQGGSFRVAGGELSDNSSLMMAPQHPVMKYQPQLPPHDMSAVYVRSGRGLVVHPSQVKHDVVIPEQSRGAGMRKRR